MAKKINQMTFYSRRMMIFVKVAGKSSYSFSSIRYGMWSGISVIFASLAALSSSQSSPRWLSTRSWRRDRSSLSVWPRLSLVNSTFSIKRTRMGTNQTWASQSLWISIITSPIIRYWTTLKWKSFTAMSLIWLLGRSFNKKVDFMHRSLKVGKIVAIVQIIYLLT